MKLMQRLRPLLLANNETAIARARICGACEHLFKPTWTCKKCGCFMKIKVRMELQDCPIGKWGTDAPTSDLGS